MNEVESTSGEPSPPLASLAYRAERQMPWRPIVRVTAGVAMLTGLLELLSVGASIMADLMDRFGYVAVDENIKGLFWAIISIGLLAYGAGAWKGKRWARKGLIVTGIFMMFAFVVGLMLTLISYFSVNSTPPIPLPIRILYAMTAVVGTISKCILPGVLIWIMSREEVKEMF